ncbi:MAG: hypothetical protein WAS36_01690, partial [Candidatus Saccharimonadales bacterium]
ISGATTSRGITVETATATQDRVLVTAAALGAARFDGTITNADLTAARTYTLPDASGTFAVSASGNIALSATGNITFTGSLTDAQVSDTLTSSLFVGSGSTTTGVDLGTAEVAGTLGVANGGTGVASLTSGGVMYGNGAGNVQVTSAPTAGQVLVGNGSNLPAFVTLSGDMLVSSTGATNVNYMSAEDNRAVSPSEVAATKMRVGFGSYANDTTSPFADYLHFNTYADVTGGNQNLVMFNKAAIGMRIYQGTFGSVTNYSTYKDVVLQGDNITAGTISASSTISSSSTVQGTRLISTVATGTAPLTVASTTVVTNLNADLLDGLSSASFAAATGSANYIQNQNASAQTTSNFWISGDGRATTSFTTPLLQSAAGAALTLTGNAASTWSTSAGLLTVQGAGGLTLNSVGTNALTLDTTTTGAINIGTNANAKTITLGNVTGATTVTINVGTGGLNLGDNANTKTIDIGGVTNSGADTVNIATNATAADVVTIGSTHASSTATLRAGAASLSAANSGVTIQNSAATTTAFLIQNAAGDNVIQVNTNAWAGNVLSTGNPSFEVNTTGWNQRTGTTLTRTTTISNVYFGLAAGQLVNTATVGAGVNYPVVLTANTTYFISVMMKSTVNSPVSFGYAADGATETTYMCGSEYDGNAGTDWYVVDCSFTTPATVNGGAYIFLKQNAATARTIYLDGLYASTVYMGYQENTIKIGNSQSQVQIGAPTYQGYGFFPNASLYVQQSRGTTGMIIRGTEQNDLFAPNILSVQNRYGDNILSVTDSAGLDKVVIQGGNSFWGSAALEVNSAGSGITAAVFKAAVGQTADIIKIQDSSSNNLIRVQGTGEMIFENGARHAKKILLNAEYAGSVLDPGSGANNSGTMTSGLDLTNRMNYYKWTTALGTNQNYDVVAQVPIPSDFSAWGANPLAISTYTTNTTNGTVTLEARDSSNTVQCNFVSVTPGSTSTWATNNTACTLAAGTYTAGDYMTLRIRMQSGTSGDTRIGNIVLNYLSKF